MDIKICGIRRNFEIEYLNILNPSYIGFVFSKSKRRVSKEEAKILLENLNKNIKVVAVFKDESISYINEVINYTNINIVQLHGKEDMSYINILKNINKNLIIWKAINIENKESINIIKKYNVDKILLDSDIPGEGKRIDLNFIKNIEDKENIIIAGGINKENLNEIISGFYPHVIDVSSGVEKITLKGERYKSYTKMKELIEEVKSYDKRKI